MLLGVQTLDELLDGCRERRRTSQELRTPAAPSAAIREMTPFACDIHALPSVGQDRPARPAMGAPSQAFAPHAPS